jgi:hypothetical protein
MVTKVTRFCILTVCKILLVLLFFTLFLGGGLMLLLQEQILSWSNNKFRTEACNNLQLVWDQSLCHLGFSSCRSPALLMKLILPFSSPIDESVKNRK